VSPLPRFPLDIRGEVNQEEARVMGLSCSEDRMIGAQVIFDAVTACVGGIDTETDGFTITCTAPCI